MATTLTGYRSADYARSLAEFGRPRLLPRSGGWLLERPIRGTPYRDAMGSYPLFSCADWSGLKADLNEVEDLVCVSLVTDPFAEGTEQDWQIAFLDRVIPFKEHFVADLSVAPQEHVSKHHRYYARKALAAVEVDRVADPSRHSGEWSELYANLTAEKRLTGIRAFSSEAFRVQLGVSGMVMLRARHQGVTIAAHLWYVQGDVVHSHLAAATSRGHELMASYALYFRALDVFRDEARWINFGAGAGTEGQGDDGLTQFKRGWASETRTAYFCGRIFDQKKYAEAVAAARPTGAGGYFPAYRRGEFG